MEINTEILEEIINIAMQPIIFGFGIATILQLLSYGVFRAFSLLNTKNYD
jgi:hypothetical protein